MYEKKLATLSCAEKMMSVRKSESIKNLAFTVFKIYNTVNFSYLNDDCLLFRLDFANYINTDTVFKIIKSVSVKSDKMNSL
jgi:hypothetical protein